MKPEFRLCDGPRPHVTPSGPNLSDTRLWFSASDIAAMRLPGLPTTRRKINELAARECWALMTDASGAPLARLRQGRGGGLDYHIDVLPVGARAAVMKRIGDAAPVAILATPTSALWQNYDRLPSEIKAEAERRAAAIAQIDRFEAAGLTRTAAAQAAASLTGVCSATLWNWMALVEGVSASDRLPLLAPRRGGGGREAEIDGDIWQIFLSDYLRPEKPTLTSCYDRAKAAAEAAGITLPHDRAFRRKLTRDVDPRLIIGRRSGKDALRATLPPTKRSVAHLHAMEAVNIDGHVVDVFVKMPGIDKPVRPTLVGIQDVYSRKLLSWRIGESESALLVRLAFADLFETFGIPKACYLDNGRAFASKWITGGAKSRFRFKIKEEEPTGLLTSLGVAIHWTLPYRGSSKPIERCWRDLADRVAKHPEFAGAYTGNKPDAKPENYGDRAIPFDQFKAVVAREIAAHNARAGRRTEMAAGRSLDQVFEESYAVSPIGKASADQLKLAMLTAEQVPTDRSSGMIGFAGNRYWCEPLSAIAGQRVIVRFDPDNLHQGIEVYRKCGTWLATADIWAATGFDSMEGAKKRARQEADLRKTYRSLEDQQQLLSAADVAARLPGSALPPELPEAGVVRAVRHRGQTAAALKPDSQSAPAPSASRDIDRRLTQAVLRLVD